MFLVEDDMMSDLKSQEAGLDDIISFFLEQREAVQALDGGMDLSIIDDSLILRPGLNGVVPDAIQIRNGLSG